MPKTINIEKAMYPQKEKLKTDKEGTIRSLIVDAELDGIECTFNYDGCVQLNTDAYSYITLSIDDLYTLIDLTERAERKYAKKYNQ
jgi:hypothetical protein